MTDPQAPLEFAEVFAREMALINKRRQSQANAGGPARPADISVAKIITGDAGKLDVVQPSSGHSLVGLALSGGGIRSAAFSLGVLQSMHQTKIAGAGQAAGAEPQSLVDRADYLSTVSGGGYIGSALSAGLAKSGGKFPFPSDASDQRDSPGVGHIRNYSTYLIPHGLKDFIADIAVVTRGLVVNAMTVVMVILFASFVTLLMKPERSALSRPSFLWFYIGEEWRGAFFLITRALIAAGIALFLVWALWRSLKPRPASEFLGYWPVIGAGWLMLIAASAFMEAQPFLLEGMFVVSAQQLVESAGGGLGATINGGLGTTIAGWVTTLSAWAAPVAGFSALFSRFIGEVTADEKATSTARQALAGVLAKALSVLAALVLPLLILFAYLITTYWGLRNDYCTELTPEALAQLKAAGLYPCEWLHAPGWKITVHQHLSNWFGKDERLHYFIPAVALLGLCQWLRPNANSLHGLYRDRLSKAFLFDASAPVDKNGDLPDLDQIRLSGLVNPAGAPGTLAGPYHLINAALNVQGSKQVNKRGRNADFFIFSPLSCGSEATKYQPTEIVETAARDLDLAAAMAISAAAASSNMGSKSIRLLTPTLAILNVRLGFWMANPKKLSASGAHRAQMQQSNLFLFKEMFSRLDENQNSIYLTDGGHIENLGIYELLKRRCKVIIAVDAEADSGYSFSSLITLQRYARIDLGIRIELPWADIAAAAQTAPRQGGLAGVNLPKGPHAALGTISYGAGDTGHLIYIKASVTGDENDYVLDYANRYKTFPHETTGDQFFSEEQFEAYRALGFHAGRGVFQKRDVIAALPAPALTKQPPGAASAAAPPQSQLQQAFKILGL